MFFFTTLDECLSALHTPILMFLHRFGEAPDTLPASELLWYSVHIKNTELTGFIFVVPSQQDRVPFEAGTICVCALVSDINVIFSLFTNVNKNNNFSNLKLFP